MDETDLDDIFFELSLLQSMYGGEVEDLRADVGEEEQRYLPPTARLYLTPLQTFSTERPQHHMTCTVFVNTDNEYPNSPAMFRVEDCKGLSVVEQKEIEELIGETILKCADEGKIVFLDICRNVKLYLLDHLRPDRGSVYDELIASQQQKEEQERKKLIQQEELLRQNAHHLEEQNSIFLDRLETVKRQAAAERRTARTVSQSDASILARRRSSHSLIDNSSKFIELEIGKTKHEFVLESELSRKNNSKKLHRVYRVVDKQTFIRYVLHVWEIRFQPRKATNCDWCDEKERRTELSSKIAAIEQEINWLLKLSNKHLVNYKAYKIERRKDCIVINLLQSYAEGRSLSYFFENKAKVCEKLLRVIANDCLQSLEFLHSKSVVHRDLRESSIFPFDEVTRTVRVADFSVERCIYEAFMEYSCEEVQNVYPTPPFKGGQRRDLYRLGVVLLSLYCGQRLEKVDIKLCKHASKNLVDFLRCCLDSNDSYSSSSELLKHPFIVRTLSCSGSDDDADICFSSLVDSCRQVDLVQKQITSAQLQSNSRLNDFEIISLIGQGGFGRVLKVRNKLDGGIYALKTLQLGRKGSKSSKGILREVQCLSSLNNEHVVRYYTSWTEPVSKTTEKEILRVDFEESEEEGSNGGSSSSSSLTDYSSVMHQRSFTNSLNDNHDSDDADMYVGSGYCDADDDQFIQFKNDSKDSSTVLPIIEKPSCSRRAVHFDRTKNLLFIQMQYCENLTLRNAIDDLLHSDSCRIYRLFREIVRGLEYIHSQNLIHRDLKPGNIFIDSSDHVKIGDFGLATAVWGPDKPGDIGVAVSSSTESGGVGTFYYSAPISGTRNRYTTKFDIYSLGIIFFEMITPPAKSLHERHEVLVNLRKLEIVFPTDFEISEKKKKMLRWLLNHDPDARPSASEILQSILLPPLPADELLFTVKLQESLSNPQSSNYSRILRSYFQNRDILQSELNYIHAYKPSEESPTVEQVGYVFEHIEQVFRAHGGLWIPTPQFLPKGTFYTEAEQSDLLNVVTDKACPMVYAPDLEYPFARLVALKPELQDVRRYFIDRIYSPSDVFDFPNEKYLCSFDFVGKRKKSVEFCARMMKVTQDVIKTLLEATDTSADVRICASYLPITKLILNACSISGDDHGRVLSAIREGIKRNSNANKIGETLLEEGLDERQTCCLKNILQIFSKAASVDDVLNLLISKSFCKFDRNTLESSVRILKSIFVAATNIGVDFKLVYHPLLCLDPLLNENTSIELLFKGYACHFLLVNRKRCEYTLATGGDISHLTKQYLEKVPSSLSNQEKVCVVGVSLHLDRLVKLAFTGPSTSVPSYARLDSVGCGGKALSVLVVYVGEDAHSLPCLRTQYDIIIQLRDRGISADFLQVSASGDLENCTVPYLVQLCQDSREKYILKYAFNGKGFWLKEKRIIVKNDLSVVVKELLDLMALDSGRNVRLGSPSSKAFKEITYEFLSFRPSRTSESSRNEKQNRLRDRVEHFVSKWPGNYQDCTVSVFSVELERDLLVELSLLDFESSASRLNTSLLKLKERQKSECEYLERCAKAIFAHIEEAKTAGKSVCVVVHSTVSEFLKRLL